MTVLLRSEIENFVELREYFSEMLQEDIAEQLELIDFSDIASARDQVIDLLESYSRVGARMASKEAAVFYDMIRERSIGKKLGAATINTVVPAAIEGFVRADISRVVKTGTTKAFFNNVKNRIAYEMNRASGNTIIYNAGKDRERVYYARVPADGDACMFCIMLASRGAIYHSAKSAGEVDHYHENCRCAIVPMFNGRLIQTKRNGWIVRDSDTVIEDYDPDKYYDQYIEALNDGKSGFTSRQLYRAAKRAKERHGG